MGAPHAVLGAMHCAHFSDACVAFVVAGVALGVHYWGCAMRRVRGGRKSQVAARAIPCTRAARLLDEEGVLQLDGEVARGLAPQLHRAALRVPPRLRPLLVHADLLEQRLLQRHVVLLGGLLVHVDVGLEERVGARGVRHREPQRARRGGRRAHGHGAPVARVEVVLRAAGRPMRAALEALGQRLHPQLVLDLVLPLRPALARRHHVGVPLWEPFGGHRQASHPLEVIDVVAELSHLVDVAHLPGSRARPSGARRDDLDRRRPREAAAGRGRRHADVPLVARARIETDFLARDRGETRGREANQSPSRCQRAPPD